LCRDLWITRTDHANRHQLPQARGLLTSRQCRGHAGVSTVAGVETVAWSPEDASSAKAGSTKAAAIRFACATSLATIVATPGLSAHLGGCCGDFIAAGAI